MRRRLTGQTFDYLRAVGSGRTYDAIDLDQVKFTGCVFGQQNDPEFGVVVRDVTATRCRVDSCSVEGVRFEDVIVDGLATSHQAPGTRVSAAARSSM